MESLFLHNEVVPNEKNMTSTLRLIMLWLGFWQRFLSSSSEYSSTYLIPFHFLGIHSAASPLKSDLSLHAESVVIFHLSRTVRAVKAKLGRNDTMKWFQTRRR